MVTEKAFEEYDEILKYTERLCFMSCGIELQVKALECLGSTRQGLAERKKEACEGLDEGVANLALGYEALMDCYECQLNMWIALKEDRVAEAWGHLVDAEASLAAALRAHSGLRPYAKVSPRLRLAEKMLFPPQTFMSTGLVIEKATCSICGDDIRICDHIPGKAYMGRFCVLHIEQAELLEVSLVDEPRDKRCRVERYSDGDGWRDTLTRRYIPSEVTSAGPSLDRQGPAQTSPEDPRAGP